MLIDNRLAQLGSAYNSQPAPSIASIPNADSARRNPSGIVFPRNVPFRTVFNLFIHGDQVRNIPSYFDLGRRDFASPPEYDVFIKAKVLAGYFREEMAIANSNYTSLPSGEFNSLFDRVFDRFMVFLDGKKSMRSRQLSVSTLYDKYQKKRKSTN